MAIFGQYTGQRVSPLPSGFLGAAMQQAAQTQKGLERVGDTIGDALKSYAARKEESETVDGLIHGQAQKAIELKTFLEGDKPVQSFEEGPLPEGASVNPELTGQMREGGRLAQNESMATWDSGDAGSVVTTPSPFSQKTELLYEIAGDKKLVDKFLSNDATLAQKKGLLANLQMYNSKLDDYSKRAAIEEHRFRKGQRDAYASSYGAGQNLQPTQIPARTVEDTTTTELATKEEMDRLRHMQETGINPVTERDAIGYDDAKFSPEEFDKLERYWAGDPTEVPQQRPPDLSNFDPVAAERSIVELPEAEAAEIAKKLDYYNAKVKPVHDDRLAVHAARRNEIDGVIEKLEKRKVEQDVKLLVFNSKPEVKKLQGLIDNANKYINNPDIAASTKKNLNIVKNAHQKKLDALKKDAGVIAPLDYSRGVEEMIGKLANHLNAKPKLEDSAKQVTEEADYSLPEGGYATGPLVETETTTREIPAETIPAEPVDRKAAHMKAFIEQRGQMTPEYQQMFDKLYPEAGIISQPVPGVPGATALFDTKGKFLQVVAPPTLSATERAAVAAITFTPNTGFTGIAPSKEEAVKMRDLIATSNEVNEMMDDLMEMAKEGEVEWVGPKKARAKAMIATLVGKMRIPLTGGGPLTLEERKYIQENLFTDPYDWKTWASTSKSQIETVKWMMTNSVSKKAKVLGLTPVGTQSAQAGGAPTRRAYTGTKFTSPRASSPAPAPVAPAPVAPAPVAPAPERDWDALERQLNIIRDMLKDKR